MNKYLIGFLALFFTAPAMATTFSGTVYDPTNKESVIGANVRITRDGKTTDLGGTTTDLDGKFTLNIDADLVLPTDKLTISYIGYETQNLDPYNLPDVIYLKESSTVLDEIRIIACASRPDDNIQRLVWDVSLQKCIPTACTSERYELSNPRTVSVNTVGTPYICTDTSEEDGPCEDFCQESDDKCTSITIGDACVDRVGTDCKDTLSDPNASKAKYKWENGTLICEIKKCTDGYLPNDDGTACIPSEGPCTDAQIAEIEHATRGELKNGVCQATACDAGFEVSDGKCVAISGNCDPMPENAVSAHREWNATAGAEVCIIDKCADGYTRSPDKMSCAKPKLSEEDSQKQIAELQKNADEMRKREQSTANKLLGAAGIGAVGIGGMQLASAAAEQNADADAVADMSAYLATFRCDYGAGRNIAGGEYNITLPGANVLLPLYNEYTTLAASLKTRKESLGMAPGIESVEILDAATSGLYDNEALGITDGAYTSLSRALMNPTGADAVAWAQQEADTAQQLQTGAITAGAGALVGILGNAAINEIGKNRPQENSANILAKYQGLKKLEFDIQQLPATALQCPSGSTGTHPDCKCTDEKQAYNMNNNECATCPGDKVATDDGKTCGCPDGKIPGDNDTCIDATPSVVIQCDANDENMRVDATTGECTCQNGYQETPDGKNCECPSGTHQIKDGLCVKITVQVTVAPERAVLQSSNLFDLNKSDLKTAAYLAIGEFAGQVKSSQGTNTNYCIHVAGHTDKTGTDAINDPLSVKRADAVKNALISAGIPSENIKSGGFGSKYCQKSGNQQNCRVVIIDLDSTKKCDTTPLEWTETIACP